MGDGSGSRGERDVEQELVLAGGRDVVRNVRALIER